MKLYVGNIPWKATDEELADLFSQYGEASANIIMDRATGRSKGFAFVEMDDDTAAQTAIDELNDTEFGGRNIKVNEARPKEERPRQRRRY